MKARRLASALPAFIIFTGANFANASVVYRGLQNIPIPTDFTGVYVNIDIGAAAFGEFTGWEIHPFFGGVASANRSSFQPARSGAAITDPIVALGTNAIPEPASARLILAGFTALHSLRLHRGTGSVPQD